MAFTNLMANELSWVDEQIQAIKPSRVGMSRAAINSIRNPFLFKHKKKAIALQTNKTAVSSISSTKRVKYTPKKRYRALKLTLILNNSAMINGRWYKLGDNVSGYHIAQIDRASVLLKNQTKKLLLSTRSVSKKLKFQK